MIINWFKNLISFVFVISVLCPAALADDKAVIVPEIPGGSAPFLLMGLLGLVLWARNFFSKK